MSFRRKYRFEPLDTIFTNENLSGTNLEFQVKKKIMFRTIFLVVSYLHSVPSKEIS